MDLSTYCDDLARRARAAARVLATAMGARKNRWLLLAADALEKQTSDILQANSTDVAAASQAGLTAAQIDRLRLTPERIGAAAAGLRAIWVEGGRDRWPGVEIRADHVVRDVLEAFPLLV